MRLRLGAAVCFLLLIILSALGCKEEKENKTLLKRPGSSANGRVISPGVEVVIVASGAAPAPDCHRHVDFAEFETGHTDWSPLERTRVGVRIRNNSNEKIVLDQRLFWPAALLNVYDMAGNEIGTKWFDTTAFKETDRCELPPNDFVNVEFSLGLASIALKGRNEVRVKACYKAPWQMYPEDSGMWTGFACSAEIRIVARE